MHLAHVATSEACLPKAASSSHFLRLGNNNSRFQRIRCRSSLNQQQYRHFSNHRQPYIRPYSESLPTKGYEWCTRCNIRCHKFEKKIGQHNACLDSPRLFGLGICRPAKNYLVRQMFTVIALGSICFMPMPGNKFAVEDASSRRSSAADWNKQEMGVL